MKIARLISMLLLAGLNLYLVIELRDARRQLTANVTWTQGWDRERFPPDCEADGKHWRPLADGSCVMADAALESADDPGSMAEKHLLCRMDKQTHANCKKLSGSEFDDAALKKLCADNDAQLKEYHCDGAAK
jgi:hypothetical protein